MLARVSKLLACPFCRELFAAGEQRSCPTCGLELENLTKLAPSYEAQLEDDWPEKPEWEVLPAGYWRRGRGALVVLGTLGAVLFFVPWVHVTVPEVSSLSGYDIARALGWAWGPLVSWIMLIATGLSRRSVAKMRGARVAAGFFCAIPLVTAAVMLLAPPRGGLVPVRFDYALGFWLTAATAVVAMPWAVRFGGRLDDLPMPRGTSRGEMLN